MRGINVGLPWRVKCVTKGEKVRPTRVCRSVGAGWRHGEHHGGRQRCVCGWGQSKRSSKIQHGWGGDQDGKRHVTDRWLITAQKELAKSWEAGQRGNTDLGYHIWDPEEQAGQVIWSAATLKEKTKQECTKFWISTPRLLCLLLHGSLYICWTPTLQIPGW